MIAAQFKNLRREVLDTSEISKKTGQKVIPACVE